MKSEKKKEKILQMHNSGSSYNSISKKLHLTKECIKSICRQRKVRLPKTRGRKKLLTKAEKLRIKRKISSLKDIGSKINSKKLINECDLLVSRSTVSRHLKQQNLKYLNVKKVISLSRVDKENRVILAKQWLVKNHPWNKTIFSDEKWFSMDGPDGWSSFVYPNDIGNRVKRQKNGGGVMIWAMIMPNGLISYKLLDRNFKSSNYIDLLSHTVVPMCRLNYDDNYWFQQDNCKVHTAKIVKEWMSKNKINLLEWPVRSPDLNPVENIWKVINDLVYDRPPFYSHHELIEAIRQSILTINQFKRDVILSMYANYRKRLVDVIEKCGNNI